MSKFTITSEMISGVHVDVSRPICETVRPEPIIFIHGGMHGSWAWRNFQSYFSEKGYVSYALNWFNHGESLSLEKSDFLKRSLTDIVQEVVLVDAQLTAAPIIVAHSMGGMVAQKYAELQHRAKAIALLAPVPPAEMGAPPKNLKIDFDEPWGPPPFAIARTMFLPGLDDDDAKRVYKLLCPESPTCVYEATQVQPSIKIAQIKAPLLIILGDNETVVSIEAVKRLAREYNCDLVIANGRGHDLPYEPYWMQSAERIYNWIQSLESV